MNLLWLVLLVFAAISSLAVGFVVLARDTKKIENLAFFGITAGISGWAIGIAGFLQTDNLATALIWAKFYYFAPLVIVFLSVIFSQRFLYNKMIGKYTNVTLFVLASLFSLALLTDKNFITESIVLRDYGKQVILGSPDYWAYSALLLICFIITILQTYHKSVKSKYNIDKQQARIFLIGYSLSCILGVFFNLILPGFGYYDFITLGPIFTTFFVLAVAYAIAKHKLFDVRLVVARTLGYASSVLLLSLVYGVIIYGAANYLFDLDFSFAAQVFLALATSFVALTFGQFRKQYDRITNKIFYRDSYEPQALFDQLNKVLVSTLFDIGFSQRQKTIRRFQVVGQNNGTLLQKMIQIYRRY